jgi:aminomethyltransferase
MIESQKYSPYEMALGRLVSLDKGKFVGQAALAEEQKRGHAREIVGLEVDWTGIEKIYDDAGLPPTMPAAASRVHVPVFKEGQQVGKATSTTWSPTLKRLIALATVRRNHARIGAKVEVEMTVEAVRHRVPATVVKMPFFNPPRKTATPPA